MTACRAGMLRNSLEIEAALTKANLIVSFIVSIESKQRKRSGNIVIRGFAFSNLKRDSGWSFEKDRF